MKGYTQICYLFIVVQHENYYFEYYLGLNFEMKFTLSSSILKSIFSLVLLNILNKHSIFLFVLFSKVKGSYICSPIIISPKSFIKSFEPFNYSNST